MGGDFSGAGVWDCAGAGELRDTGLWGGYGGSEGSDGGVALELHGVGTDAGDRWCAADEPPGARDAGVDGGDNDWAEVGFYVFSAAQSGYGWQWVGDHIRPRVRAPDKWHLPVGLSLSTEVGYQRPQYSPDTWTWEIRPIVDKTVGRWYFAFNPALERTLHGPDVNQGLGFSPGAKVSYDFTKKISGGFEYYADYGRWGSFDDLRNQQQQLFVVSDLNVSPVWKINFGIGIGPTASTDHLIVKGIIGRRFSWGKRSMVD